MCTLRIVIVAAPLLAASLAAPADGTGGPARPAAAPTPPSLTFTGKRFPPPGLPEDQTLLGELLCTQRDMLDERALGLRTVQRLGDARTDVRLAEASRAAPAEVRPALDATRRRLVEAWEQTRELLARPWPVDPRLGCRERGIAFEVLMGTATAGRVPARLVAAREDARRCLARMARPVVLLREANRRLRAAMVEADAALRGADTTAPSPAREASEPGP